MKIVIVNRITFNLTIIINQVRLKVMAKKTQEEFLEKSFKIYGNKYDYSKSIYNGNATKLIIICSKHGEFLQTPSNHWQGHGCMECSIEKNTLRKFSNQEQYLEKCFKIHGPRYDYSKVIYLENFGKIIIGCRIHGWFEQKARSHLKGYGCPECGKQSFLSKIRMGQKEFINKCFKVHGKDKYDYSKSVYNRGSEKLIIICKIHGEFEQKPRVHLAGHGCPSCKFSKGEIKVANYLNENNIKFKPEFEFDDCMGKRNRTLPFDFAILNEFKEPIAIIEFHGGQHYHPIDFYGGEEKFNHRKELDAIKKNYCVQNNIPFLEIPYWEADNVDSILKEWISNQFREV